MGKNHTNQSFGCCTNIGVEYDDPGYNPNWIQWSAPGGCDADDNAEWQVSYVGDDWNDVFSSFVAGAYQCQVKHHEHSGFGGAHTDWDNRSPDMGALDDETSSLRWG
jgi:hypothetical protein